MNTAQSSSHQFGFTLIELMVVIVIMGILASLIVMNIGGIDQRKAMQAREILIMDLKRINREANDQSRILALVTQSATDVSPFQYRIDEYQLSRPQVNAVGQAQPDLFASQKPSQRQTWMPVANQKAQALPDGVSFSVEAQSYDFKNANNAELLGANAPKLIWLGNGEVKPVSIQMYYDQKPVGELIQVDYLGKVIDEN
ncbi:type II secretion system protein [Acinetobacter sp. 187]|uniref:type II secretion system protein n=1 Tax=Acinetobacter lanii TaxID=2715163 RepID=UPI0014082867|nr:type II secretion system protein [Acinetobacter lanii]NHC03276.1 type II secretion system protein [Acinetobacter lanii]